MITKIKRIVLSLHVTHHNLQLWRLLGGMQVCRFLCWCLLVVIATVQQATAQPAQPPQALSHLQQLQQKISRLKSHLHLSNMQQARYQQQLAQAEVASGHLALGLHNTHTHLQTTQSTLATLRQQAVTLQQHLAERKAQLGLQLRQIYLLGRPSLLQLLLGQQPPEQWQRMLTYDQVLQQAQRKIINQVEDVLRDVATNRAQTQSQAQQLQLLKARLIRQQRQRQHLSQQRRHVLQLLARKIQTESDKLQALQVERSHLQQTLSSLKQSGLSGSVFINLRHHLPWPTSGLVRQAFGVPVSAHSPLASDGLLIAAPQGQAVHAVAAGEVVFARWLAGYGLLMILDHGDGYMTLYGRCQSLAQAVGTKVKAGAVIASVGESGGFNQPGLYFAVRHLAKPEDPITWLQQKRISA